MLGPKLHVAAEKSKHQDGKQPCYRWDQAYNAYESHEILFLFRLRRAEKPIP